LVIDPRLPVESLPWPLQLNLAGPLVEVGTVGYSSDCNVEILPPLPDRGVMPLRRDDGRQSAIHQYDNLKDFAAARARMYRVDPESLREGLIFTEAAAFWDADLFISNSVELHTPAGNYTHDLEILSEESAVPLLGLFLRSRGECVIPDPNTTNGRGLLPRWWFYRVGAWALLPEAHVWSERWPSHTSVNRTPDWAGLDLYVDPPFDGLVRRFSHALRARDRILTGMLGLDGNESHDVVLYETESLMLQLSATLDLVAKIVGRQFTLDIPSTQFAWTKREFKNALRTAWPDRPEDSITTITTTARLLALIRNRIHDSPPAAIAGEDAMWFALPSEVQANFRSLAGTAQGAAAWGAANIGLDGVLIDPWNLTEQATRATVDAVRLMAGHSIALLSDTAPFRPPPPWPWDLRTADVARRYLGL
jgi:hypothetical protein